MHDFCSIRSYVYQPFQRPQGTFRIDWRGCIILYHQKHPLDDQDISASHPFLRNLPQSPNWLQFHGISGRRDNAACVGQGPHCSRAATATDFDSWPWCRPNSGGYIGICVSPSSTFSLMAFRTIAFFMAVLGAPVVFRELPFINRYSESILHPVFLFHLCSLSIFFSTTSFTTFSSFETLSDFMLTSSLSLSLSSSSSPWQVKLACR